MNPTYGAAFAATPRCRAAQRPCVIHQPRRHGTPAVGVQVTKTDLINIATTILGSSDGIIEVGCLYYKFRGTEYCVDLIQRTFSRPDPFSCAMHGKATFTDTNGLVCSQPFGPLIPSRVTLELGCGQLGPCRNEPQGASRSESLIPGTHNGPSVVRSYRMED